MRKDPEEFRLEVAKITRMINALAIHQIHIQIEERYDRIEDIRFAFEYCGDALGALVDGRCAEGHLADLAKRLKLIFPREESRSKFLRMAGWEEDFGA